MDNENKEFGKGIIVGVATTLVIVLLLLTIVFVVGYNAITKSNKDDNTVNSVKESDFYDEAEDKIETIMKIMDKYYLEEYDEDAMIDGMLAGMLAAVGDPYTGYYDAESYTKLMETNEGIYCGIGVVVQQNVETGEILVVNPYNDCPGAEAGMRPGDLIYKVAGVDVVGMDINEVVAMIRGEEGTTVEISVLHEGDKALTDLGVERRQIETHTVEHKVLEDNIGYIQVTQFDEITTQQFVEGMDALADCGVEGIIVDLRDNPGGSLTTVIDMLDTVLPKGIYTYLVDKDGNRQNYKGKSDVKYDYPMVVLVNENSASASELFTGAVKDYGKATVVGTTTFGKGIVQQVFPLKDGTGMKVTMAKYYTPNGVCIHKTGVEPDVVVELDEGEYPSQIEYEEDEQLQKAVEILKEQLK